MKYCLSAAIILILAACSAPRVSNIQVSPGANLSNYKTIGFYELTAAGDTLPEFFNERVGYLKAAITKELTAKGYALSTKPELWINIGIVVKEEVQKRETNWQTDGRYRYVGQRNYSWKVEEIEVGRYRNGTVTVHIIDAASNNMLWRGSVEKVIPDKKEMVIKVVDESMTKLFAQFPASAK